jgi:putative acetyltransferase
MPDIHIRTFQPSDADAFRTLSEEWIAPNFGIEAEDRLTLDDPQGHILEPGGQIFMVVDGEKPIGCCALIPLRPGVFEVAKMSITQSYRGNGIGRKVLAHAIEQAKLLGADSLYLESSAKLADAIHLYESLGFRHLPPEKVTPSPYARANVFMDLQLHA